ncbi:MAG: hypothetical protein ACFFD4_02560 [Candidatus Odinarchaeota archaeon]
MKIVEPTVFPHKAPKFIFEKISSQRFKLGSVMASICYAVCFFYSLILINSEIDESRVLLLITGILWVLFLRTVIFWNTLGWNLHNVPEWLSTEEYRMLVTAFWTNCIWSVFLLVLTVWGVVSGVL